MNLLITGGSGFIGRNIIEKLGEKYQIIAPTHAELELTDDEQVREYLDKNPVDVVIHSAIRPGHRNSKDSLNQFTLNTRMFFNLVRNSNKFKKMIYLSTGAAYDMRYYKPKMKEEYFDEHVPVDEMGLSKYIAAKYIEKVDNIIELRIFGIFGKYEDYSIRFISNMICKAIFDLPLTMKQNRRFDYIYIDDLMPVIEYFLNNQGAHKAYNITPDSSIELLKLAEKVKKISGKDLPIKIGQPGLGPEYSGDNSRLRAEIKGLRFTPIDDAIRKLYNWYQDNKNKLDKDCLLYDK